MEGTVKYAAGSFPASSKNLDSSHSSLDSEPSDHREQLLTYPPKQIWAVGGGKGGVGKSLLASSLAITLARMGKRVVAVDLDLGGSNLHTTLGVDLPKQTLSDFISRRVTSINDCLVESGIQNLSLISGAQDAIGITSLRPPQKFELLKEIKTLDTDFVIFDLGAGTGPHTLDFFLFSDAGIIALLPEPTSIENSYRFIKGAYYRYLMQCRSLQEIRPLIETAMDPKNALGIRSPADLFKEANKVNPEAGIKLKIEIEKFKPNIVVNQTRTQTDVEIGNSVRTVCKKYFGIDMEYVGHLDYDSCVWQSVRRKRPLMLEFPHSKIASSIDQVTQNLLKKQAQLHENRIK